MHEVNGVFAKPSKTAIHPKTLLYPILEKLFGETFSQGYPREELSRMCQSSIYLLKIMGFPLEAYPFRWVSGCGPASRMLTYDFAWGNAIPMGQVVFRKDFQEIIDRLRAVIERLDIETYSVADWLQCMAAIHYLRSYVMKWNASIEEVVSEVERRMPAMSAHDTNIKAAQWLDVLLMNSDFFAVSQSSPR